MHRARAEQLEHQSAVGTPAGVQLQALAGPGRRGRVRQQLGEDLREDRTGGRLQRDARCRRDDRPRRGLARRDGGGQRLAQRLRSATTPPGHLRPGHHQDVVAVADATAGGGGQLGEVGECTGPELTAAQAFGQQLLALRARAQPVGECGQHGVGPGPGSARRGTARPVARRVVSHVLSSERSCDPWRASAPTHGQDRVVRTMRLPAGCRAASRRAVDGATRGARRCADGVELRRWRPRHARRTG